MQFRTAAFAATFLGLFAAPAHVQAQDIIILASNSLAIVDGADTANRYDGTDFGQALVDGGTVQQGFDYTNQDNNGTFITILGQITISGPSAADFTILNQPAPGAVNSNIVNQWHIVFNPSTLGVRTATVSVPNSDPDSEGVYTFAIRGTGVQALTPTPNLNVAGFDNDPKSKTNSNTGITKVKWKTTVKNTGNAPTTGGTAEFFVSLDEFLDPADLKLNETIIKGLPAFVDGKKTKQKKVKLSAEVGQLTEGYLFVKVTSFEGADSYGIDNIARNSFFPQQN